MTPPLPDRIAAAIDDDLLIDNAACASQLRALVDEETTRQAIKDNICAPFRAAIAEVVAERDAANAQRDEAVAKARHLEKLLEAECRLSMANVDAHMKANAQRDELLRALICRDDPLNGHGYRDLARRTIAKVREAIARAQSGQPAQRDDDGTASGGGAQ